MIMKLTLSTTYFALALASLVVCPPLVSASAGKAKHAEERESVDVEHRTTSQQKAVEPDAIPEVARDMDEHQGRQQEVITEHRETHRESGEQKESHHHDD
jgi:hypothetical protein